MVHRNQVIDQRNARVENEENRRQGHAAARPNESALANRVRNQHQRILNWVNYERRHAYVVRNFDEAFPHELDGLRNDDMNGRVLYVRFPRRREADGRVQIRGSFLIEETREERRSSRKRKRTEISRDDERLGETVSRLMAENAGLRHRLLERDNEVSTLRAMNKSLRDR